MSQYTKATTSLQLLAIFLHRKLWANEEGWPYEVQRVKIGETTTTLRGVTVTTTVMSTYGDDEDNLHDWNAYAHKSMLAKASMVMQEVHRLDAMNGRMGWL